MVSSSILKGTGVSLALALPLPLDEPEAAFHSGVGEPESSLGISVPWASVDVAETWGAFSDASETDVVGSRVGEVSWVPGMFPSFCYGRKSINRTR